MTISSSEIKNSIKKNIDAVLFDLDGTLLNTDDQAVEKLASRLQPISPKNAGKWARQFLMFIETPGNMFITLLDMLGLDEPMMGFTDKLRRQRGAYPAHQFELVSGALPMLRHLHGRYQLGIVTTRSRFHINALFTQFPEIEEMMETSCGLQDSYRLKPHPAPVRLAAQRLNLSVERCLMVGDTTVDVKAAKRAGAWSVGVLCGFGEREELEKAGAHLVCDSVADLANWL